MKVSKTRTKGHINTFFSGYIQNQAGKPLGKYISELGIYNISVSGKSLSPERLDFVAIKIILTQFEWTIFSQHICEVKQQNWGNWV